MTMAGASEKEKEKVVPSSRALHNFTFPPNLQWGHQKQLRCVKFSNYPQRSSIGVSSDGGGGGDKTGIEAVREKLMNDLKVAADQLKFPIREKNQKKSLEEELPWNLRNRRSAFKVPSNDGFGNVGSSDNNGSGDHQQKSQRFSISLSKEEIETDFLLMTGAKPPRRPKKRPKSVQKQIEGTFPGSWLTEITPEYYKVADIDEPKIDK